MPNNLELLDKKIHSMDILSLCLERRMITIRYQKVHFAASVGSA